MDFIGVPKIWKLELGVRKLGGNDIELSNPFGDQATHFTGCTKSPNVDNSSYNHKNVGTSFDVGPTICVSSTKEGKNKNRVGCYCKVKNTKVNQSKQHSSQWIPLSCT
jgi:hypothetical protein